MNSTSKSTPIEAAWELVVDGKSVAKGSRTCDVAPGGRSEPFEITLKMPEVDKLTAGELILTATRDGKEVFREAKPITVVATDVTPKPKTPKADLVVLDPSGEVKARLTDRGIPFTEIASVDEIKLRPQTLILGRNAVPANRSTDRLWQKLLLTGARVVALEQEHPLHYQAVPADFDVSENEGSIAFGEDFSHPVLAGLNQDALFCWHDAKGHRTYRGAYRKATQGRPLARAVRQGVGLHGSVGMPPWRWNAPALPVARRRVDGDQPRREAPLRQHAGLRRQLPARSQGDRSGVAGQ